jgi:ATP-dependent exoDNAse (exonuclease V) beta subunit
VIGAVNEIGSRLDRQAHDGPDESQSSGRHEFSRLRVGLEPGPDSGNGRTPVSDEDVQLLLTTPEGWAELDLGPLSPAVREDGPKPSQTEVACQAEALALARHIRESIDSDGYRPADVAILFRSRSRKWMYAEALKQVGLKPYIVGGSGFWQTREGIDLMAMLGVIANPRDDESLLPALTGMACGLSSDALWMLRRDSGHDEPLWPILAAVADGEGPEDFPGEDRERAERFVTTVREIRKALATMPLESVVEEIVTGTGYDLACTIRGGAESLANVRQVASLADEFEESEGRNLRGFLDWAAVSSEIDSEAAVATEEEDSDVVRLMTMHKAKGLEFEMVCLAELGRQRNTSGEKAFWVGTPPDDPNGELTFGLQVPKPREGTVNLYDWNLLFDAARREKADEELRLFHVGLTRAKRRLVLSGVDKLSPGGGITETTNTIHRVVEAFGIDGIQPELLEVPAPEPGVPLQKTPTATRIPITRIEADQDRAARLREGFAASARGAGRISGRPPLHNRPRTRHTDVPLSFTALDLLEKCSARFYATRILKLDEPDHRGPPLDPETLSPNLSFDSTRFGSAVHDLLERSANRRWVLPGSDEIRSTLTQRRVDDPDGLLASRAAGMIEEFAASPLGERVRSNQAEIEIPLLIDILGVTVRGFVDLLLPKAEPPLVLDYKSNRLEDSSPDEKMEDYTLQRDLYGLAVARATGSTSVETAFVFLEEPASPAIQILDRPELESAQMRLEGLVGLIREGAFFGGSDAAEPCRRCWACKALDSRIDR